jgi:hypothetical protein
MDNSQLITGLQIEGVFADFMPIKCQIRIKEGVGDVQ